MILTKKIIRLINYLTKIYMRFFLIDETLLNLIFFRISDLVFVLVY